MKTILIKGYYGVGNLGDDLILNTIVSSINEMDGNYRILVCGGATVKESIADESARERVECVDIPFRF